jgi:hypothetical protein
VPAQEEGEEAAHAADRLLLGHLYRNSYRHPQTAEKEDPVSSVIQRETVLTANQTVDNIVSGSAFEFMRNASIVSIGIVGSATGLVASIIAGGQTIVEESPLLIKTAFPSTEDDMYYQFGAAPNDRLVVRVRNTTAGSLTVRILAQIQPVR